MARVLALLAQIFHRVASPSFRICCNTRHHCAKHVQTNRKSGLWQLERHKQELRGWLRTKGAEDSWRL